MYMLSQISNPICKYTLCTRKKIYRKSSPPQTKWHNLAITHWCFPLKNTTHNFSPPLTEISRRMCPLDETCQVIQAAIKAIDLGGQLGCPGQEVNGSMVNGSMFFFINLLIYGLYIGVTYAPWDWNIYLHFTHQLEPNVGKFSIHGAYGEWNKIGFQF